MNDKVVGVEVVAGAESKIKIFHFALKVVVGNIRIVMSGVVLRIGVW